ncbi:MAG: trypsin-like peptidase domain-containing protein, partial [Clostridiales bacterium]|nr:trypsin-like peptidase domain-containing protein [Clostridiales bacterium]
MSEEFYPEHEIHTDPVENQQTEQQTWQAAQQQTAQQTWQAAPQQPSSPAPEAKKKGGKAAKVVALLLACALVGGGSGFGAAALMQKKSAPASNTVSSASSDASVMLEGQRQTAALQVASIDTSKALTPSEVYAQNVNSTVGITTSITTNYFGYQTTGAAAGSGFILTADGYILTNYHVVESSDSIKVTTYDGTSYDAQLIGYDESNDIAVLKIDATDLTPVVLGDSDTLNVGDSVVAIGNPLGELTFSLTTGVVSALDRPVTFSTGSTMNLIQTDCAINSGNSGGPLFNSHGEVIGIVSAKYSSSGSYSSASVEGLGFAIPMDDVANMVSELVTNGYVTGKPLLGISVNDVDENVQAYGVPAGAEVIVVTPGLCGEKAGLKVGDIITKINDTEVTSAEELISAKNGYEVGDTVELTVYRSGETTTVKVTLEESTPEKEALQDKAQQEYQQQ